MFDIVIICQAFVLTGIVPGPAVDLKELERLQGEWYVTSAESNGRQVNFEQFGQQFESSFKGTRWVLTGEEKKLVIRLDPSTELKMIDLRGRERGREGRIAEGIYKLEGDTLTICYFAGKNRQRPTEFKSDNLDTLLLVLKRPKK